MQICTFLWYLLPRILDIRDWQSAGRGDSLMNPLDKPINRIYCNPDSWSIGKKIVLVQLLLQLYHMLCRLMCRKCSLKHETKFDVSVWIKAFTSGFFLKHQLHLICVPKIRKELFDIRFRLETLGKNFTLLKRWIFLPSANGSVRVK